MCGDSSENKGKLMQKNGTLQILVIISITVSHHFSLLGKLSLKPQDSLNNHLFYFDLSSVQINSNFLVTGNGNWWKKALFGVVKRTAWANSLSLPCSSLVCSVQGAKALGGRAHMSGGNTEVQPARVCSLHDHSITELALKHSFPSLETFATIFCLTVSDFPFRDTF